MLPDITMDRPASPSNVESDAPARATQEAAAAAAAEAVDEVNIPLPVRVPRNWLEVLNSIQMQIDILSEELDEVADAQSEISSAFEVRHLPCTLGFSMN